MLLQKFANAGPLSILAEFDRLQNYFDRRMSFPESTTPPYPAINLWAGDDAAVVTVLAPGLTADDLEISVFKESLILKGRRAAVELSQSERWLNRERFSGEFSRAVQLPFSVNVDAVTASIENGQLKVVLPRAQSELPRRIAVSHLLSS